MAETLTREEVAKLNQPGSTAPVNQIVSESAGPATRTVSAAAKTFGSFREAFLAQSDTSDGRSLYKSRDELWILAATELQAMKAWNTTRGPMIERLSTQKISMLVKDALKEVPVYEHSDSGELS